VFFCSRSSRQETTFGLGAAFVKNSRRRSTKCFKVAAVTRPIPDGSSEIGKHALGQLVCFAEGEGSRLNALTDPSALTSVLCIPKI